MRPSGKILVWAAAAALGVIPNAHAQRADENAVAAAEDAFGTRLAGDNVGLYSPNNARGFNPSQSGNNRLEGLYWDQQAFLGRQVLRSTSMRVGLSAQSYPFAAPTGIADNVLIIPDQKRSTSSSIELRRPTGLNFFMLDTRVPLSETFAAQVATTLFQIRSDGGSHNDSWNFSSVLRWNPTDEFEIIPFGFWQRGFDGEVAPSVFTGGAYLPPRIDRDVFYGQEWADRPIDDLNGGVIMRGNVSRNWRVQAGVFHSDVTRSRNFVVFYRNVQPTGMGSLDVLRYPEHSSYSTSGEVRASGVFTDGAFRHTVHLSTRARDTHRLFGGGATTSFGAAAIGTARSLPEPRYVLGVRDNDVVKQVTPGLAYVGQWANVGEFSIGLQKSFYARDYGKLGAAPATTKSRPWLYNGTVAYYVTTKLAVYGSYTRGLEEFGTAPDNTLNAGEPLQAEITEQIDAGVRYVITPGLTFMAGVFEVSKPYFDRDGANVYTVVGDLSHRGVEMSLTGRPLPGLTVVAGALFLKARVTGLPVDRGLIGEVVPGTAPRVLRFNTQYSGPAWRGFMVEGTVDHEGAQMANRANTLRVKSLTTVSVGARYPFAVGKVHANIRAQVSNLFNTFVWTVDGNSGRFAPNAARQYFLRLAADF